ncbi:hypothetical protein ABC955_11500 [Citromicrobium bathyomarinum]|uniref:hypothetical protein n=1 Tax=Sphingomonadales TaxID=204457 RepID=UPI0012E30480|nr:MULTISPECIES: hypothetical protein [Sphingomonadales]|tara:strand:+ start:720 stop:1253 length:534 start_codon:yes stop_codon:yes gene_type:complete
MQSLYRSSLDVVDWIVEPGVYADLYRIRSITALNGPVVKPYFDLVDGQMAHGLIGCGFHDGSNRGIAPSPNFNAKCVAYLLHAQKDGVSRLSRNANMTRAERQGLLAEQIFISSGLLIAGRELLNCGADPGTTAFILAGLKDIRKRLYCGCAASGEIENLRALLVGADCLKRRAEAA